MHLIFCYSNSPSLPYYYCQKQNHSPRVIFLLTAFYFGILRAFLIVNTAFEVTRGEGFTRVASFHQAPLPTI